MRPHRLASLVRIVHAAGVVLVLGTTEVPAHDLTPRTREIVRLQGRLGDGAMDAAVQVVAINVLGQERPLRATDWRRFTMVADTPPGKGAAPGATLPARVTLHGERSELQRFAAARTDQLVTLLAERREGSPDLFLLTLDLCPPH
jgi:hypothetical protein